MVLCLIIYAFITHSFTFFFRSWCWQIPQDVDFPPSSVVFGHNQVLSSSSLWQTVNAWRGCSPAWPNKWSFPLKLWPTLAWSVGTCLGFGQRPSPACCCPERLSPSRCCWPRTLWVTARDNLAYCQRFTCCLCFHLAWVREGAAGGASPEASEVGAAELLPSSSSANSLITHHLHPPVLRFGDISTCTQTPQMMNLTCVTYKRKFAFLLFFIIPGSNIVLWCLHHNPEFFSVTGSTQWAASPQQHWECGWLRISYFKFSYCPENF